MVPLLFSISVAGTCIPIADEQILASHLAARIPVLAPLDSAVFGFAPRFGMTRIIPGSEIRAFARKNGLALETAHEVCITRPTDVLTPTELKPAVQEALSAATDGHVNTAEILDYSRQPVPRGVLKFEPNSWVIQPSGNTVLWRGAVRTGGGGRYPIWVKLGLPGAQELLRRVRPSKPRDVKAGQTIAVQVIQGNARLLLDALAETSGRVGERILLKNLESGRRFSAIVAGPAKAVIGDENAQKN